MKRVFLILLGLLNETEIQANCHVDDFQYYIGLNGSIRYTNQHPKLGHGLLATPVHQIGIISGFLFNDYFGAEFGCETSFGNDDHINITKIHHVPVSGTNLKWGQTERYEVNNSLYSVNLGIIGYFPFFRTTNIFVSGGIAYINFNSSIRYFGKEQDLVSNEKIDFNKYRSFKTERIAPYIKTGFHLQLTDNTNIRLFADWKDTKNSVIESVKINTDMPFSYRDTFGYGIGFIYAW